MHTALVELLDRIREQRERFKTLGEEQAKQGIVVPILRRLGWDTESIDEVRTEYSVESRRVDYALVVNARPTVFIEAKRSSEYLDDSSHEEQLLDYSFRETVDLAILTNGLTWSFYLPREGGNWRSRRFYTVDVVEQEASDAATKLIQLLSKPSVCSGESLAHAQEILRGKVRKDAIADTLPEAWNKLIQEPDSLLVDLIAETTERMCGFKPEQQDTVDFLRAHQDDLILMPPDPPSSPVTRSQRDTPTRTRVSPPNHVHRLSQDALIPYIIRALKQNGGRSPKERVEQAVYAALREVFEQTWYTETVSHGIPRWQHNLAWAKERAKKRGLVQPPEESGRGWWALTEAGSNYST